MDEVIHVHEGEGGGELGGEGAEGVEGEVRAVALWRRVAQIPARVQARREATARSCGLADHCRACTACGEGKD